MPIDLVVPNSISTHAVKKEDVLLGKGQGCNFCIGTIAFKALIVARMEAYIRSSWASSSHNKVLVTREVFNTVHEGGGRFLIQNKKSSGVWDVVRKDKARLKIRDAFRHCAKNLHRKRHPSVLLDRIGLSQHSFSERDTYAEIIDKVVINPRVQLFLSQISFTPKENVPLGKPTTEYGLSDMSSKRDLGSTLELEDDMEWMAPTCTLFTLGFLDETNSGGNTLFSEEVYYDDIVEGLGLALDSTLSEQGEDIVYPAKYCNADESSISSHEWLERIEV